MVKIAVAPLTGAWIEIGLYTMQRLREEFRRSPHGSVDWNCIYNKNRNSRTSRSPHGSVDWNTDSESQCRRRAGRSPHGSVDWNLLVECWLKARHKSLPSRERGLKFRNQKPQHTVKPSLPSRERGLKWFCPWQLGFAYCRSPHGSVDWNNLEEKEIHINQCRSPHGSVDWNLKLWISIRLSSVAPLTGAWIEIYEREKRDRKYKVAPLTGAWIEIACWCLTFKVELRRSPHGSVDWNTRIANKIIEPIGRSPHGSVDWNLCKNQKKKHGKASLPSRERGLKCKTYWTGNGMRKVAPLTGAWIEI